MPWTTSGRTEKMLQGNKRNLYIDQHIHKEVVTRRENVALSLIVYNKAYDRVQKNLDNRKSKMYKTSDNVMIET